MVSAFSLEPYSIRGRPTGVQITASITALPLLSESLCLPHESFHTVLLKNKNSLEFYHSTVNNIVSADASGNNLPNFQSPFVLFKTDQPLNTQFLHMHSDKTRQTMCQDLSLIFHTVVLDIISFSNPLITLQ